jgi:hypothetical protein
MVLSRKERETVFESFLGGEELEAMWVWGKGLRELGKDERVAEDGGVTGEGGGDFLCAKE